jgi:uncharacterized protein YdaU (DUF1376 family)
MTLAYFPLYPDDFEADTAHLTLAEDGAYNRLLRLCWRSPGCSIPADLAWVYRRLRASTDAEKEVVDTVLAEFFTVHDGRFSNARLTKEFHAACEAHERRKNAGAKGGKAKSLKIKESETSIAVAKPKQPEPEPEPYIEEAKASSLPRKRATRLPAGWVLPEEWLEWSCGLGGSPEFWAAEADKFRDYWTAKASRDAAKMDWLATWRNWCRNASARRPQGPANITQFPRIRAKFHEGFK